MQSKMLIPIIRLVVILIFLGIVSLVVQRLPMLTDLNIPDLNMSAASLGKLIISLIMIGVIWNFGQEFAPELQKALPSWPESASLLKYLVFLVAVLIAYGALLPLASRLLIGEIWIYQVLFVLLALFPVVLGGLTLYKSVDKVTNLLGHQASKMIDITCPNCGTLNPPSGKFCQKCGKELASQVATPATKKCSKCGTGNSPEAGFCSNCGNTL